MSDRQVIERVWQAPIEQIWELWTTAEGIASWFGPKGFIVEVQEIDLRVGGTFAYSMRSTDPETVAAMEKRGAARVTRRRLNGDRGRSPEQAGLRVADGP